MDEERVDRAYTQALARAFWRGLRHRVTGGCNDLVSTADVLAQLPHIKTNRLGTQSVALADIVGSTGRYGAFDLAFWPRRRQENGRWQRVAQARSSGKTLPPVQLYKIGRAYFVEDGNHRISVARARGETHIPAVIVEIDAGSLPPEPACTRLGFKI